MGGCSGRGLRSSYKPSSEISVNAPYEDVVRVYKVFHLQRKIELCWCAIHKKAEKYKIFRKYFQQQEFSCCLN